MNDLDQKIQAALRRDSAHEAAPAEPNLAEEVIIAFRGRNRWLTTLLVVFNLAFFGGALWAGRQFYYASTAPAQLQWGITMLIFLLVIMFLKLWFWLEMHTNRVLREVKRVELLLLTKPPAQ